MEEPKINFGVWHPTAGSYPELQSEIDFGAWYTLEPGIIENETFEVGDWLVYIQNSEEHWKKSKGLLIFDDDDDDDNEKEEQTTIPGEYTKVRIDANGNVIDGSYLLYEDLPSKFRKGLEDFRDSGLKNQVLEILKTAFLRPFDDDVQIEWEEKTQTFNFTVNIDDFSIKRNEEGKLYAVGSGEGGGSEGCANHKHTPDDITDLDKYILNIINNYSFIENVQNHLEEFVDGTTVIVNQNGKLSAVSMEVGPHTHSIDEIVGLDKNKVTVWASEQGLHNEKLDFNEGAIELKNESIGSSIYYINNTLKEVQKIAEDAKATANGEIDPGEPGKLKEAVFTPLGNTYSVYDIKKHKKIECYKTLRIGTNSILAKDDSVYKVYLDNTTTNICTVNVSNIFQEGNYGEFKVTYFGEAYPSIKTFQNKYKGFSFELEYEGDIDEGYHDVIIREYSKEGVLVFEKQIKNIPIGKAPEEIVLEGEFPKTLHTQVSGVKRYSGNTQQFNIELKSKCISKYFAPLNIFKVKNNLKGNIEEYFDILKVLEVAPAAYLNYLVEVPKEDCKASLEVTAYDIFGNEKTLKIQSPYFHYDTTTTEVDYRVKKDEEADYERYIDFNSEEPLSINTKDCLFENDIAKITHTDYTEIGIGPNYSNYPDIQQFVLKFKCDKYLSNFYFDIEKENGKPYTTDKYGRLNDIEIFAAFSDADNPKNWISCNDYWTKNEKYKDAAEIDLYKGLDLFRSDKKRRWVTLGPSNFIKHNFLYIKVVLKKEDSTVNIKTLANSIEECIDER